VNNPFSDALNSLGQNVAGLATGTNPLFAPQIAQLFGLNIPGLPLISPRNYFLQQLSSWFSAIPMSTQWIVLVDAYPAGLNTSLIQSLERTDGDKSGFDIDAAKNLLTNYGYQKVVGCLFAHAVTIPHENFQVQSVSIPNNRGFLPGVIAGGRYGGDTPMPLTIEFKETNTSFLDFVIRPWVILASHFGMVSRNPTDPNQAIKNMKATIHILQYTRTRPGVSQIPRKAWTFYNCVPYDVPEQALDYVDEKLMTNRTFWTYSNYTVASNLYLPVVDIINSLARGNIGQAPIINPALTTGGIPG
jgi:hypothetical protein